MKLWSINVAGNLHDAARSLNELHVFDVVAMDTEGGSTTVVYIVTDEEFERLSAERRERNKEALR
jgi:hypothetical protein